jgi:DNA-binding CsgD family transcriptional regulator
VIVSDVSPSTLSGLGPLSLRESRVLEMTSRGLTNAEVAALLDVSIHTVKFHLSSVYRKLGVSNRTEAAAIYLRTEHGNAGELDTRGGD